MPKVKANNIELHFDETGSGPEPLVLVHGWTGNHHIWDDVVAHLPLDRVHVYAFDLRGAGQSDRPATGYSTAELADDIAVAAASLGLGPYSFAGHSLGGAIGMQLGLRHPDRLKRLILVAPAPAAGTGVLGEAGEQFYGGMSQVYADPEKHVNFLVQALTARQLPADALSHHVSTEEACAHQHLVLCWQGLGEDISGRLPEIATPTLIAAGDSDLMRDCNLQDHARIPGAALQVFYRVGHMIPWEAPRELADVMVDFIENGAATPAAASV